MKQAIRLTIMMVLLMAAQLAYAQSGDLENHDKKMRYSFSGGTITEDGEVHNATNNSYVTWKEIHAEATTGTTIRGAARRIAGPNNLDAAGRGPVRASYIAYEGDKMVSQDGTNGRDACSISYTIPRGVTQVELRMTYLTGGRDGRITCSVIYKVKEGAVPAPTPPEPEETVIDCSCSPRKDSHIRFNDWYGQVMYRCYHGDDDDFEMADWDAVIYECDLIKTWDDSGCILGLEDMSTYVMKEETRLVINTEDANVSKFEMLVGTMWSNMKKMAEGKSLEIEMSQCVAGGGEHDLSREAWELSVKYKLNPALFGSLEPDLMDEPYAIPANYTLTPAIHYINDDADDNMVFACEVKNGVGTAYVLKGEMTLRNKNNKTYKLKAGQSGSIGKDNKIVVKKFDVNKMAKKLGITNADLQGFRIPTLSAANTANAVKRYEMERAIVKYKVTKGSLQGVLAKAFDDYGRYERRELRLGDVESIALLQNGTSYALDKKTKIAKRTKDADLNFLDMNESLMKKLNLTKKGTVKVMGKECTLYTGNNVEYYVWKGLVMKKVQKEKNGTTTIHEVTSIEEPTSVDPKMFKMPEGYTVK